VLTETETLSLLLAGLPRQLHWELLDHLCNKKTVLVFKTVVTAACRTTSQTSRGTPPSTHQRSEKSLPETGERKFTTTSGKHTMTSTETRGKTYFTLLYMLHPARSWEPQSGANKRLITHSRLGARQHSQCKPPTMHAKHSKGA
jgi:hypothetical protein